MLLYRLTYRIMMHTPWANAYKEWHIRHDENRRFYAEAKQRFKEDVPHNGNIKEYKQCLHAYRVTYDEYENQYCFWEKTDEQRKAYVSVSEMHHFYRKMVSPKIRNIMRDKICFLTLYKDYIYRKWLYCPQATDNEIFDLLLHSRVILKPVDGSRGQGIFFIEKGTVVNATTLQQWRKDHLLMETCVESTPSIAAFNPESLNTIRVVTFRHGDEVIFYSAAIRFGRIGHKVDNAHAGGIRALIDIKTGLAQEGVDTNGKRYTIHPDSKIAIQGFQVPYWDHILETCKQATLLLSDLKICGWDLCIRNDGRIELIEGNHAPDIDGIQFSKKCGIREELNTIFRHLYQTTL